MPLPPKSGGLTTQEAAVGKSNLSHLKQQTAAFDVNSSSIYGSAICARNRKDVATWRFSVSINPQSWRQTQESAFFFVCASTLRQIS
jgi:hypothetical protein